MDKNLRTKIIMLFLCFVGAFFMVLGKAVKVQIIDSEDLISRSESQIFREITVYPKRGSIFDRNGNPLAINIQTYSIFTIPKNLENKNESKSVGTIIK